ncbi:hypothetical protein [Candidatus Fokinia crypta]|uniref:Uncharacterized protein n=1 Tax=Candidatus Fokinia crypta TaxID=1920990 RepID=A0ABZ0UP40_9RICK|nr:hypothetical protein [Candidatus Fokinia cryptica]WPX97662.1 hypothetical protein Fokcrypt_00171 [Candidatus Fokinia cryptica]
MAFYYLLLEILLSLIVGRGISNADVGAQKDKFIFSIYGAASDSSSMRVNYTEGVYKKSSNVISDPSPRIGLQIGSLFSENKHVGIDASYLHTTYKCSNFSISQDSIALEGYGIGCFELKNKYYLLLGCSGGLEYNIFQQQSSGSWNDTIALQFGGGKMFDRMRIELFIKARRTNFNDVIFKAQNSNSNRIYQDNVVIPESVTHINDIPKYDTSSHVVYGKPTLYLLTYQEEASVAIIDLRPNSGAIEYGLRISSTF